MREPNIIPPLPWTTPCRGTTRRIAVAPAGLRARDSGSWSSGLRGPVMSLVGGPAEIVSGLGWTVGVEGKFGCEEMRMRQRYKFITVFLFELVLAFEAAECHFVD